MTITITTANQKGGVGKTNSTVNIGHGLALRGYNVLLVDIDPQGHLATVLGMEKGPDLVKWLRGGDPLRYYVQPTGREKLSIIRSDITTADYILELGSIRFREKLLARALAQAHGYDVVLIDSAPSRNPLQDAAIMASDYLLVPTQMAQLSSDGLAEILGTLNEMRENGARCELLAVIPTLYERTDKETTLQLESLVAGLESRVWSPVVKDAIVKRANREGKTLYEMGSRSKRALAGYNEIVAQLVKELR